MPESNKIFCGTCRHYASDEFTTVCNAVSTASSDWHGEGRIRAHPKQENKNNDCRSWQHKRGFAEWLYDLLYK